MRSPATPTFTAFTACLLLAYTASFAAALPEAMSGAHSKDTGNAWEEVNKSLFWTVSGVQLGGYSAATVFLYQAWYKDYPRSGFHFHNDMPDWLQMDKAGHLVPAYILNKLSAQAFRMTGLDHRRSAMFGAISAQSFMTAIEVMDGFSAQWGFSIGDLVANILGSAIYVGQEYAWESQRIAVKWSHSPSGLAKYRPDLLGSTPAQRILKDYNGDTYWLSFNLHSLSGVNNRLPEWLNLALGYSAYGMLGTRENPTYHNGMRLPDMERRRQWILSPDVDLSRIPTNSRLLQQLFKALNVFKVPAPAIEYNRIDGWRFHLLYF